MGKREIRQNGNLKNRTIIFSLKQCVYFSCRNKLLRKCTSLSNISGSKAQRTRQNARNVRALKITCRWYQRRMNNYVRKEKGHTPCRKNKRRILILYSNRNWGTKSKSNWNKREHSYYGFTCVSKIQQKTWNSHVRFFLAQQMWTSSYAEETRHSQIVLELTVSHRKRKH